MKREDESGEKLYVAGESVPSGIYKHLDSPYILELDGDDTLPARLDGRPTYYVRLRHTWGAHRTSGSPEPLMPANGLSTENDVVVSAGQES